MTSLIESFIGKTVLVRTYSAGVWCGTLEEKAGDEVVLGGARRMWRWWAKESISLSGVAKYGIKHDNSKIAPAIEHVWMQAIEIIPLSEEVSANILGAPEAGQE